MIRKFYPAGRDDYCVMFTAGNRSYSGRHVSYRAGLPLPLALACLALALTARRLACLCRAFAPCCLPCPLPAEPSSMHDPELFFPGLWSAHVQNAGDGLWSSMEVKKLQKLELAVAVCLWSSISGY